MLAIVRDMLGLVTR